MNPTLYRKRIIPDECIELKDDLILYQDDSILVTKWKTIRPKKNMDHGYSCYFLKEGYKVSKFINEKNKLVCWYCDIIEYEYKEDHNAYYFTDLLADVIIYPDHSVQVVDLEELSDALDMNKITIRQLTTSLRTLNNLLQIIYNGQFHLLKAHLYEHTKNLF